MIEKDKIRGFDIVSGILFIFFGLWILVEALKMPLAESYGSAKNAWYVSPALFPLIIGGGIVVISILIVLHALRNGGFAQLMQKGEEKRLLSEKNIRYLCILIPLFSLVYVMLKRIDFIQSSMFFLFFTVFVFYIDNIAVMKRTLVYFTAIVLLYILLTITGIIQIWNTKYPYLIDVISLVLFILLCLGAWFQISSSDLYRGKFKIILMVSIGIPFFLAVVFRFLLRIPLPREGGFTDLLYILFSIIN
jgi:hypothetical protein